MFSLFNKDKLYGPKGKTAAQKQSDVVSTFGWREGEYMLFWNSNVVYCAITIDGVFYKPSSNDNGVCIPIPDITDVEYVNSTVRHDGYDWGKVILHMRNGGVFQIELPVSELSGFESGWGQTPNPEFWDDDPGYENTQEVEKWEIDNFPDIIKWRSKVSDIAIAYVGYTDADPQDNMDPNLLYASVCYRYKDENNQYQEIYIPIHEFQNVVIGDKPVVRNGVEWIHTELSTRKGATLLMDFTMTEFDEFFNVFNSIRTGSN